MKSVDINTAVMMLFIIMVVGYIARKKGVLSKEINIGLTGLLINVSLPLLIISSFNRKYDAELMKKGMNVIIYAFIIHIFLFIIGHLFFMKNEERKRKVQIFYCTFSNTGFMGFPILGSIYGEIGVFYAALFNIAFNVLVWTMGVSIFTGDKSLKSFKKIILNPSFIAVIVGIVLFRFSITLPNAVNEAVKMVGDTTTPISMIIIGSMLAEMKVRDIFADFSIYYGGIVRLVIIPGILYIIMNIAGIDEQIRNICIVLEAMPAAVTTAIIAQKYDGDALYASQSIFITNVLCLFTIPLVIKFLGI